MTHTEKAQVVKYLQSRRDDYREIAKWHPSKLKAYAFNITAQAFDIAAKDAYCELKSQP